MSATEATLLHGAAMPTNGQLRAGDPNLDIAHAPGIMHPPTLLARRRDSAAAVNNDFQNHSFARRRDPDFPLRTLSIFPTNDASQRGS
jgi:hypothetical protein